MRFIEVWFIYDIYICICQGTVYVDYMIIISIPQNFILNFQPTLFM